MRRIGGNGSVAPRILNLGNGNEWSVHGPASLTLGKEEAVPIE